MDPDNQLPRSSCPVHALIRRQNTDKCGRELQCISYERVLILIDSINNSLEVLWRRSFEENPACMADQLNVDEK